MYKYVQTTQHAPAASTVGPGPTIIQIRRTPHYCKLPSTIVRPRPLPSGREIHFHEKTFVKGAQI